MAGDKNAKVGLNFQFYTYVKILMRSNSKLQAIQNRYHLKQTPLKSRKILTAPEDFRLQWSTGFVTVVQSSNTAFSLQRKGPDIKRYWIASSQKKNSLQMSARLKCKHDARTLKAKDNDVSPVEQCSFVFKPTFNFICTVRMKHNIMWEEWRVIGTYIDR